MSIVGYSLPLKGLHPPPVFFLACCARTPRALLFVRSPSRGFHTHACNIQWHDKSLRTRSSISTNILQRAHNVDAGRPETCSAIGTALDSVLAIAPPELEIESHHDQCASLKIIAMLQRRVVS